MTRRRGDRIGLHFVALHMSAHGPGRVKKASYWHYAQNSAAIGALNAIFLESILRAARDAPRGLLLASN